MVGPEIAKTRYLGVQWPESARSGKNGDIFSHPKKKWKKNGYSGKTRNGKEMEKNGYFSKISIFFNFFDFRQEKPEMEKKWIFSRNIHFFHFFDFRHFPKISIFFHFFLGWEKYPFFSCVGFFQVFGFSTHCLATKLYSSQQVGVNMVNC